MISRIIFYSVHGKCPLIVDHIDRNRLNNSILNLREVTRAQDGANKSVPRDNRSGYTGVYFNSQRQKWMACISANLRSYHLGSFETKDEAIAARREAVIKYHGEYGNLPA